MPNKSKQNKTKQAKVETDEDELEDDEELEEVEETEEEEIEEDEEASDDDEAEADDDDEEEETPKAKKKGKGVPKTGAGSGLVPREPVAVPKEIFQKQSPEIRALLAEREKLQAKGDKKGLRKIRMRLRSKGFYLNQAAQGNMTGGAGKTEKAEKTKKKVTSGGDEE